jgi:hypothetical protein
MPGRFPIFPDHCHTFARWRVPARCTIPFQIAAYEPRFIGGDVDQIICADTDHDPIVVIYRQVDGIERVTPLTGLPVLDLIARDEIPDLTQNLPPETPPDARVQSAVRRLSGATMLDPRTPEMLGQVLGFAYLPLDEVAINPEIGFLFLRTKPGITGDAREGRAGTNLLWEVAEDTFHGMPLLTDTAEVAARMYGERPKGSSKSRPTIAPQR